MAPLWFLGVSALLNIGLDLLFVLEFHWDLPALTCLQQSALNFGILLIQRLVDSFGPGMGVCAESDGYVHQGRGNGGPCFRRRLSAAGGGVLRPDRLRLIFSPGKGPSAQSGRAVNLRFSPFQGKVMR